MLKKIAISLIIVGILLSSVYFFINSSEPKVSVSNEITINAKTDTLYKYIKNLDKWNQWYPIFTRDKNAKVEIYKYDNSEPKGIDWQSKTEGSGVIKFGYSIPNSQVNYTFFIPELQIHAIVKLSFLQKQNTTILVWQVEASTEDTFNGKFRSFLFRRAIETEIENIALNLNNVFSK
jgi:hypothetical protein